MKFSIWEPKNKEMLYRDDGDGFTIQDIANGDFHPLLMTDGGFESGELRKELVFRPWVGLNDINDTPIYEGDFISYKTHVYVVTWNKLKAGFSPFTDVTSIIASQEIKVVGNKYQNAINSVVARTY